MKSLAILWYKKRVQLFSFDEYLGDNICVYCVFGSKQEQEQARASSHGGSGGGGGGGGSPIYKSDGVIVVPFRVRIRGLVPGLRVLKSKMTFARGMVVPFSVLSRKI